MNETKQNYQSFVGNCYYLTDDKAKSKEYYENKRKRLQQQERNCYRNLSQGKKIQKSV